MTSPSDEPSFAVKILEDYRSGTSSQRRVSNIISRIGFSGNADNLKRKSTEIPNESIKLLKMDATPQSDANKNKKMTPPTGSPWETHRVRSQLLEANIKISDLENQISRHHSLRQEMELLFKKERESLQKQVDSEKAMIKELEHHLQEVRLREIEVKEQLRQCKLNLNRDKINFEEHIQELQRENAKLTDNLLEMEQSVQNERMISAKHIQCLREELSEKDEMVIEVRKRNEELEHRVKDGLLIHNEFELLSQELQNAQIKIKDLEKEKNDYLEAAKLVKSQQEKLFRYPELERELLTLKETNSNLKQSAPKYLLLEEMVQDLKSKQAVSEEQVQDLAWAQGRMNHLQNVLDEWYKVAGEYCDGYMSSSLPPDPAIIRKRINELQQNVHILTSELSDAKSQINEFRQKKDLLFSELQTAKKDIDKHQGIIEQHSNRIRLLQKKLHLLTIERDCYRLQLDSYEKDLTISSSNFGNLQFQQLQQKLENTTKLLENYKRVLEKVDTETDRNRGSGGNSDLLDRLHRMETERNTLLKEKQQLQKRKDELEIQLEYRAIKGDFNPITSKVLHFRNNPKVEAEVHYEDEVIKLRAKCTRLEERVKLLEEGNVVDITQKVEENVTSSNSQEVQELKEMINKQELKMKRYTEVFHASAKEFRDVCYELFGYKIDRNENIFKLSSMYADSPDDFLMFKRLSDGSIDMMETDFSSTLGELMNIHLHHQNSPPLFLGAVTVELFNRQTLTHTISESIELN